MRRGFFATFIYDFLTVTDKSRAIKADEEKRAKFSGFGITSIIFSVLVTLSVLGAVLLFKLLDTDAALLFIFIIVGIAACLGGALMFLVCSLTRVIAQFTINRKPISFIALAILIAAVIACVLIVLLI